jgi:hypothetical protein
MAAPRERGEQQKMATTPVGMTLFTLGSQTARTLAVSLLPRYGTIRSSSSWPRRSGEKQNTASPPVGMTPLTLERRSARKLGIQQPASSLGDYKLGL